MAQTAFILLLLEDDALAQRLRDLLRQKYGYAVVSISTLGEALDSIRQRVPDVVVADATLGGEPTPGPLAELLEAVGPDAALLLLDPADPPARKGQLTVSVLSVPENRDKLVQPIAAAARRAAARREDRLLRESIDQQRDAVFEGIVGVSAPIRALVERIRKASRNKMTVLILGETGAGKELIAHAIHKNSDRANRPFKPLNCTAVNENLLESTLFGHVRGAFTGADRDARGYFEAAEGGTVFLDEIGDMPLNMQAKLLRVLEHREVTPVGSTEIRRVDVRVIAATNADLHKAVSDGRFRADLFYRLHGFVIKVPPLRERREDIPLLADYFRRKANRENDVACDGISSEAMHYLAKYYWPGNVRELRNVIEAAVVEVENRQIEADDLPEHIRGSRELVPVSTGGIVGLPLAQLERIAIERTLQATGGNREKAAKLLEIGTRTLYRKIKEYGL